MGTSEISAIDPFEKSTAPLDSRSRELRRIIISMLAAGRRGHVGSSLSLVEILRVLYDDILKVDPRNPWWAERDRCILSKGHGCPALFAVLGEKGFFSPEEYTRFCAPEGILGGHPERGKVPGVEASTGSLGHGLPIGTGMAIAARLDHASYRVFVISSDGECNEGSTWEAALAAAKHRLSNLTVLIDYNKMQSFDSSFKVLNLEPLADKWRAFGFAVAEVDGHDVKQLRSTLQHLPFESDKPNLVICHTIKGRGIPFAENNPAWHHKSKLSEDEIKALYQALEG